MGYIEKNWPNISIPPLAMGGNARWMAAAIMMDGGGMIAMDGGSGNGQWRCNGWHDNRMIAMGNEMAAARWMA